MNSQLVFDVYRLTSLVGSIVIATLYVWPSLSSASSEQVLGALIAPQAFVRLIGLGFLVLGVVGAAMSPGFALYAGIGDYFTAVLALIAMVGFHSRREWGKPAAWVFNLVGTADLLNAFLQAGRHRNVSELLWSCAFRTHSSGPPLPDGASADLSFAVAPQTSGINNRMTTNELSTSQSAACCVAT
jgi:hypothetical protein